MWVDAVSFDQAVADLLQARGTAAGRSVHLCNAYTLSIAQRDPEFAALLNRGDLNYPDGKPVYWAGRRTGPTTMHDRVYGPDLMAAVVDRGQSIGLRHYLYGSTMHVVTHLREALLRSYPHAIIVGTESPPFRPLEAAEEQDLLERLRTAEADVVWVGLGTPLQDQFVDRFRDQIPATLVAIGAAFDFLSGAKPSAPGWMKRRGLEWLYRLAREPRRLWRRYLIGNAVFLWGLVRSGVQPGERSGAIR